MAIKWVIVFTAVILYYLERPADQFSKNLTEWKTTGKYYNFNGYPIYYKDLAGTAKNGENLILLHGFPTMSYDWVKVVGNFQTKFSRIIMPDFIGLGFSAKPYGHRYSMLEWADMVEEMLKNLNVNHVHILAHDIGDTVAQEIVAREKVKKLKFDLDIRSVCFTNGGMFPETNFPRPAQQILRKAYIGPVLSRLVSYPFFSHGFSEIFGPQTKPSTEELTDFWTAIMYNDGYKVSHGILQYLNERTEFANRWTDAVVNTKLRVHTIFGTSDSVNPAGFVDFYKKICSHGISTMKDIGHYPHWEDPENFIKHYNAFVTPLLTNVNKKR